MSEIHNNPKMVEPRMPVILSDHQTELWLSRTTDEGQVQKIIEESNQIPIKAHTVAALTGKGTKGNTTAASEELFYRDLGFKNGVFQGPAEQQLGLF